MACPQSLGSYKTMPPQFLGWLFFNGGDEFQIEQRAVHFVLFLDDDSACTSSSAGHSIGRLCNKYIQLANARDN
jgi:hypothetical protein